MLDEDEAQSSAEEDSYQSDADPDKPVAEAVHAVVILPATARFLGPRR
jgi:hypothetical protein